MTAGIAIPPDVARAIEALRAEDADISVRQAEFTFRRDKIRQVLEALEGLYAEPSSNGDSPKPGRKSGKSPTSKARQPGAKPRQPGRRLTDEGVRDYIADVDFHNGRGVWKQLTEMGVASSSVAGLLKRARKLGLLDHLETDIAQDLGEQEQPNQEAPTPPASAAPAPRASRQKGRAKPTKRDDAWIRSTWATLDPAKSVQTQLVAMGVARGGVWNLSKRARALGLTVGPPAQNGEGASAQPSEGRSQPSGNGSAPAAELPEIDLDDSYVPHKSWAQANAPLREPKAAEVVVRDLPLIVDGLIGGKPYDRQFPLFECTDCEFLSQDVARMMGHTQQEHARHSFQSERTPLTKPQREHRGLVTS